MRATAIPTLILGALVWLGPPGGALELTAADGSDRGQGFGASSAGDKPVRKLSAQPDYAGANPIYVNIDIGSGEGRHLTAVIDESKGTGKGYDTLYLDANNDGDLTNDPKVTAQVQDRGNVLMVTTGKIPVTVRYADGSSRQLGVALQVYRIAQGEKQYRWMVRYNVMQHLEARIEIDGLELLIGLYDRYGRTGPANGCFNDFGRDSLRVDTDGDGKLGPHEEMPLSRVFMLAGKLREIKVDAGGRDFSFGAFSGQTGDVKLNFGYAPGTKVQSGSLTFAGADGCALTCSVDWKGAASLPAGTYRIDEGTITVADAAGDSWALHLVGSKPIEVAPGGTVMLGLGAPVRIEPLVRGALKAGGQAAVSHRVVGAAGEVYDSIAKGGRNRVAPPDVKILDAAGTELASGSMEYG